MSDFEPSSSTSLIVAAAAGASKGLLPSLRNGHTGNVGAGERDVLELRVRFDGVEGLVGVGDVVEDHQNLPRGDVSNGNI